jgi:putative hydrolase of the HAD superfamily
MQFKAVIFDLGDTLILTDNWDYVKCLRKLLESLQQDNIAVSIPFKEFSHVYFEARHQMYVEYEESLKEVDFQLRITKTLKRFNYDIKREEPVVIRAVDAFVKAFVEDLRMENYVPELLRRLKEKYKLGLVSNFAYAPGFWEILKRFNLCKFFDAIMVSGELGLRKPHPKIFEEALKKLAVRAEEAVFVGDSLKADINGAKRIGFKTVFVENIGCRKNPYAVAGELDPFPVKPDAKIPNLRDLPKILESL